MKRLVLALVLLALALPAQALDSVATFEALTVAASSTPITSSTLNPVGRPVRGSCVLTLADGQIRYRLDGTAPTSSVGHVMDIGGTLTVNSVYNLSRFRAIRTSGTSGVLSISCW